MNAGRRPLIAGNWKMQFGPAAASTFAAEIGRRLADLQDRDIAVFPPAISIPAVAAALTGSGVACGGQDCHWEAAGAFTGETSPAFLAESGCRYVLVGHSERRTLFGETDETCGRKVTAAARHGLVPVLCCGETLHERDSDQTFAVIERQLSGALADARAIEFEVAYEPVWAIGTGRTATAAQAGEAHAFIRDWLARSLGADVAARVRILYGGSVKPDNIESLLAVPHIDGALVGGASLKAESFEHIARGRAPKR